MGTAGRSPVNRVWRARLLWLAIALIATLYCAWRFAGPSPLQTNLLALLPPTEADPVAEQAVDALASALGERTVFLVTSRDAENAKKGARLFGASLAASGAFAHVLAELPPFDTASITRFYLPYRFGLLSASDRAALVDGSASPSALLAQRLFNPVPTGLTVPLADDPFGWLQHWLAGLPLAMTNLEIEDNLLVVHRGDTTSVLVTATLPGSAYETKTQTAVRAAVAQADEALARALPGVHVAKAGAVFYAEAARSASEREVHWIGMVSVCGIALLMLWVFRSPRLIVLGFVSTAFGVVCALAATMLLFGKLHLLTLVFGASLIGEAVDYSIQYFVLYLSAGRDWDARRGAREVRPALSVALATSLLGYAILAWVPFPALKQIACFAMVGIGTAFASVMWLLPALLLRGPKRAPIHVFARAAKLVRGWQAVLGGRRAWLVAALVIAAAAPGWSRLTSDDDIHLLVRRDPGLAAQERDVRAAIGVDTGAQFFVVQGSTPEQVLERAEALGVALDRPVGGARLSGWQSVTQFVPSAKQQANDRALLASQVSGNRARWQAALGEAGFRDEVAARYLDADAKAGSAPLTVDSWLAAPWSQPYRHLWLGATHTHQPGYAAIVMPLGASPAQLPALAALAQTLPGVSFVDKAASVSRLFGEYRVDSGLWLAGALVLVAVLLMGRYGVRGGGTVMLPVLLAVGVTLAVFGYAGMPLNLFNWLALMLVLGVGANYAVFLREGCAREHADLGAVWTGVVLSAFTTLLSFGLLGMSSMPVLKSFGVTLALGIAVSVALAPIGMPARFGSPSESAESKTGKHA
jgi:predicted exporter